MANNNNNFNPYTTMIPAGSLNKVTLTQPNHVTISWPNTSNKVAAPSKPKSSLLVKLFG